ncbi:MAG: ATP-dependent Clp protease ATP-binding subunit [Chloroflexota bacterium]|nr:ATP-dependent Clp protease ATP-binding subunit [Chloroflexota bacterium]MDE2920964.1 ATP-dependent Clp protease ATP-binding subunit [Chloroflexota bacterium]
MDREPDEYAPVEYLRRLTGRGRRVIQHAELEAARLGHDAVGPGHVLLAILEFPQTAAARVLRDSGIDLEPLRDAIVDTLPPGYARDDGRRPLSAQGRNVLRSAALEAERMGVRFIGTEHLLLGALANAGRLTSGALAAAGVEFRSLRRRIEAAYQPGSPGRGRRRRGRWRGRGRRSKPRSMLAEYGSDFTNAARTGDLDPVIGRQLEMDRAIEVLLRRTKNNPVLVGDAGVGKTAIVEGLAHRIVKGDVPEELENRRLISLSLPGMIAGAKYRGEFEERVQQLIAEVRKSGDVILFIDELHTVIGAGGAAGSLDAANLLKGHLARGEVQVIGATTWREYRRYIANDKSLNRRFQPIDVDEPSDEDAIEILKALRPIYESYHGVEVTDDAVDASVHLSRRYVTSRQLPDKAIDLVDEAAARAKVLRQTPPTRILELLRRIKELDAEIAAEPEAPDDPAHPPAARRRVRDQVADELRDERAAWEAEVGTDRPVITPHEVAEVLSSWIGVPLPTLAENESDRFLHMEDDLRKRVVGQDDVLAELGRALRRALAGMRDERRPIGSFLFLGESGVGKTETAKALAQFVSGTDDNLVRVDMSEMSEYHSISRLIGSPPGYVGFDEAGGLTEAVRRNPYSVVLFDDVEKAHPRTLQVLLQIMEDGLLTDANGRHVDFRSTIVVLTSNLGVDQVTGPSIGFESSSVSARRHTAYEARIREYARRQLPGEFLNRLDRLVVFRALEEEDIREIARRTLSDAILRAENLGIRLHITSEALDYIVNVTLGRNAGARPIAQLVGEYVDQPLTDHVMQESAEGREFELRVQDGNPVIVETTPSPAGTPG